MANAHVLTQNGGKYRLVMHLTIPVANNSAVLSWQTALLRSGISSGKTVLPDGDGTLGTISAAEKAAIVAGSVYEWSEDVDVTEGGKTTTGAGMGALVDAYYTKRSNELLGQLQAQLQWYGATR